MKFNYPAHNKCWHGVVFHGNSREKETIKREKTKKNAKERSSVAMSIYSNLGEVPGAVEMIWMFEHSIKLNFSSRITESFFIRWLRITRI